MAVIAASQQVQPNAPLLRQPGTIDIQQWIMANGDTATEHSLPYYSDRSVQVGGTFGVGGSVSIQGTIDGITYETLTDPQGNALTFTAAKVEAISELVRSIKPVVTAGDGTTSLRITIIGRA